MMNFRIIVATHFDSSEKYPSFFKVLNNKQIDFKHDLLRNHLSLFSEVAQIYEMGTNDEYDKYDILGLAHYRRFFDFDDSDDKVSFKEINVNPSKDILKAIKDEDKIVIAKKTNSFPYKTIFTFSCQLGEKNRQIFYDAGKIVYDMFPAYQNKIAEFFNGYEHSQCNMFLMQRKHVTEYVSWLFNIYDEIIKIHPEILNIPRSLGYISECFFNIWVMMNFDDTKILYVKHKEIGKKI